MKHLDSWTRLLTGNLDYPAEKPKETNKQAEARRHKAKLRDFKASDRAEVLAMPDYDLVLTCIQHSGVTMATFATEILLVDISTLQKWLNGGKLSRFKRRYLEIEELTRRRSKFREGKGLVTPRTRHRHRHLRPTDGRGHKSKRQLGIPSAHPERFQQSSPEISGSPDGRGSETDGRD